jgi:hypothetical protein
MWSAAVLSANEERETHSYQNRTGFLEGTTGATLVRSGFDFSIDFEMPMEYATYVVDDFGLSRFREIYGELVEFYDKEVPTYLTYGLRPDGTGTVL